MKSLSHLLRVVLGLSVVLATCLGVLGHRHLPTLPERFQLGAAVLFVFAAVCTTLFWRVRSEDRSAHVEAALCRAQKARSQADQALAESDLLLGRLTGGNDVRRGTLAPLAQLMAIQAELQQVRTQYALDNPLLASRIDLLCTRVDRVAQAVAAACALEAG
jgi:hypothetical protein